MKTRTSKALVGATVAGTLLVPSVAAANFITYNCVGPSVAVADGNAADTNPLPNEIRVIVNCADSWKAVSGEINASYNPITGTAKTVVGPLTITNVNPSSAVNSAFDFTHEFPPGIYGAVNSSSVDGVISNATLAPIGHAQVVIFAYARAPGTGVPRQELVNFGSTDRVSGLPPIPFSFFSQVPIPLSPTYAHVGKILYYIENQGDFVQLQPGNYFTISIP